MSLTPASQQINLFRLEYSTEQYEQALNDSRRDNLIIELKYWVKKFEAAESLRTQHVTIKNPLIRFTNAKTFKSGLSLRTVRALIPFLRSQLVEFQSIRDSIPQLRTHTIPPLGTTTLGEMKLEVAERAPGFETLTEDEQNNIIHKAVMQLHSLVVKKPGNPYMMDTATITALWAQHLDENTEKYRKLLVLSEEALKAIRDAPIGLPHMDKLRLQQKSVRIQLRIADFQRWFIENQLPVPGSLDAPLVKKSLLDKCKDECVRRGLPKGDTLDPKVKYEIAEAIELPNLPRIEKFKPHDRAYQLIGKMLSELGYSRKKTSR